MKLFGRFKFGAFFRDSFLFKVRKKADKEN